MWTPLLALVALLLAGPASAADFDVPYYMARPAERAATLARCRNDARHGRGPICENAQRAEDRDYARRQGAEIPNSDTPMTPLMRAAIRHNCTKPAAEQSSLLGQFCGRT